MDKFNLSDVDHFGSWAACSGGAESLEARVQLGKASWLSNPVASSVSSPKRLMKRAFLYVKILQKRFHESLKFHRLKHTEDV